MTRYYIRRGKPEESWESFGAHYMGIPARGYFLRKDAAERAAGRIAQARGGLAFVFEWCE
jgi:hypothetical protein